VGDPDSATAEPPRGNEARFKAVLDALDDAAPRALPADELCARVGAPPGDETLRNLLWAGACAGAIQLHVHAPRLATTPGDRPVASLLARVQLESSESVTNLRHEAVKLDDAIARRLLPLVDGTRDCAALAAALGEPRDAVEARVRHLAKLALLLE
jgi:hypothetical protein